MSASITPTFNGENQTAGTFTRGTQAWGFDPTTGKLKAWAVDTIRKVYGSAGTDLAFLLEPQRSNVCQRGYLTGGATTGWTKSGDVAAVLSSVTDAAALAAAGLDDIASDDYVLKLDNSGGSGVAYATSVGTSGNTNKQSLSVYWRGSGTGYVRMNNGPSQGSQSIPETYTRNEWVNQTPASTNNQLEIAAEAGAIIYFIFPQHEEGETCTSVIPNATAGSVTRNVDAPSLPFTETFSATDGITVQLDIEFIDWGGNYQIPLTVGDSAPYIQFQRDNSTGAIKCKYVNSAGGATTVTFTGAVEGTRCQLTIQLDPSDNKLHHYVDDTEVGSGTAITLPTDGTTWGGNTMSVNTSLSPQAYVYRWAVSAGIVTPAGMQAACFCE